MISLANESDIDQLMHIEDTMFDEAKYIKLSRGEFIKILHKHSSKVFVWKEEQNIVGYSLGILVNKKHVWFNSLAVLKEWQSTTAAKDLFAAVEDFAQEQRLETIILEIREDNKALLRRYKSFGYCEWKRIPHYYPDGCSAIRMIKKMDKNA